MEWARPELKQYSQSLARLLTALDSEAQPEQLKVLTDQASEALDVASKALTRFSPSELQTFAGDIDDMRRWLALAHDKARCAHAKVGESLADVARARQALARLEQPTTGDSCDVAG